MLDTSQRVASPHEAIRLFLDHTKPVSSTNIPLAESTGRVLAQQISADRDSPPIDVSAMDGYAVRYEDLNPKELASQTLLVKADAAIGQPPIEHPPHSATRMYTGAPVPKGADTILPREWTTESDDSITLLPGTKPVLGKFIRRAGENCTAHEQCMQPGAQITPPVASLLASFGLTMPGVYRKVRISIILPGDELLHNSQDSPPPKPWIIRDANGPGLSAMLAPLPWVHLATPQYTPDNLDSIRGALREALAESDAVFLAGGVSAGQRDFVPPAIRAEGATVLFHGVRQRPGGPMLGAVTPDSKLIFALPGNPISALVCARIIALPVLRYLAGNTAVPTPSAISLESTSTHIHNDLWQHPPVQITSSGSARLIESKGSGDIRAAALSDGVVQIPPNQHGPGPWPFFPWSISGTFA